MIRRRFILGAAASTLSACAITITAFGLISLPSHHRRRPQAREEQHQSGLVKAGQDFTSRLSLTSRLASESAKGFYREHGRIPLPKVIHHTLRRTEPSSDDRKGILVIGDVHGCIEELLLLHKAAIAENDGKDFEHVILVGDMVNKGPSSQKVIAYTRQEPRWLAVRGNHDDGALAAALGDMARRSKPTYARWVDELTPEDIDWMTELPYTIRIPVSDWPELGERDVLIVHAALLPGTLLHEQDIRGMTNGRNVMVKSSDNKEGSEYEFQWDKRSSSSIQPWAREWSGPEDVIFGHDARRGLQLEDYATGLDTGACYGGKLTAILLPQRTLVSVLALQEYSPVTGKPTNQ